MIGLFGIVVSLVLLMYLAYKGFSVIILAPVLALFAVIWSGMTHELLGFYSQVFMSGLGGYIIKYFPLFLLGAVFGKLMDDSGSARTIAIFFVERLGHHRAMLSIVISCAILTYGGVSLFVVGFAVFPIASALFKELGIPKRFIPAAIMLGALTFTMTALPGTPAIQNAIPMPYFKTDLNALKFLYDVQYDCHSLRLVLSNLILSKVIFPSMDTSYLATAQFGHTNLNSVIGLWSIITALVIACIAIIALNWKRINDIRDSIQNGVSSSFLPIFNTASEVGYGSVIASLAGFVILKDFL
ncbi:MAG: GntP family permease, partial [Acinetobacter sp.]|nr:GntP family permease [Acinetobacter sp.]